MALYTIGHKFIVLYHHDCPSGRSQNYTESSSPFLRTLFFGNAELPPNQVPFLT